jgi:hypothetical protein
MGRRKGVPSHRYTPAEKRFLAAKAAGRSHAELTELFNRRFGLSISVGSIGAALDRLGVSNGRDGRFQPGNVPRNKGKKGRHFAGSEKGWFAPRHRPHNWKPVGTERISPEGYVEVKIRNPNKWKAKHRIVWEKANGKIPRGRVVLFADRNKFNFALDNLLLVSRAELAVMNHFDLISESGDLTRTGKLVADLKLLAADRKRGKKKKQGRIKRA